MANRYMKRYSTLLIIREMQINITKRYHLTTVSVAVIKKTGESKCWQGCGGLKPLYIDGGNENGAATLGNSLAVPQKVKKKITI